MKQPLRARRADPATVSAPRAGPATLRALDLGFRERYLDYETLHAQLKAWADAFPGLARLESIGRSGEGRELWMLTVGPDPDRTRPAVWVGGNLHALELAGSSVALAVAEDALRLHLDPAASIHGLPAHVADGLREVVLHVLPRISPDGAEAVLESGRYVRSVPRDPPRAGAAPRWVQQDVDGDGAVRLMRREDPTGEWAASREVPGVLVRRRIEDPPPYFKVWPEGMIEHFDGRIPDAHFLSDNGPDLNRNFPAAWAPEPEQPGAGERPGSEPESQALLDFAAAHPNLYAWLDLHTFGGVFIRPLGDAPDIRMDRSDLAVYREIGAWAETFTGYPTVSAYEQFTYVPEQRLRGDIVEWAYRQRATVSLGCELWDLFSEVGVPRQARFVDTYAHFAAEDMERVARWDAEHNGGRIFRPWAPFDHPQLGRVEIGGIDGRVGLWNPPPSRVPELAAGVSALWMRVAALVPRLELRVERVAVGEGVSRIRATVSNHGYLPTFGVAAGRALPFNGPVTAEAVLEGPAFADGLGPVREVGHLDGWGRGRFSDADGPTAWPDRGSTGTATVEWLVRGAGEVVVRAGSPRLGRVERRVAWA